MDGAGPIPVLGVKCRRMWRRRIGALSYKVNSCLGKIGGLLRIGYGEYDGWMVWSRRDMYRS